MSGSIHTSHRLIVTLTGGIYVILALVFAVLPAVRYGQLYPAPTDPVNEHVKRGRELYVGYGCIGCHTQQIRGDQRKALRGVVPVLGADRRFGLDRPSRPEDYAGDDPSLLGTQRTGPDLSVVGSRLPGPEWHYWHFYDPRAVSPDSVMPAMRWLFKTNEADVEKDDVVVPYIDALHIPGGRLWATPRAQDLVEYLLSLTRPESSP